MQIGPPNLASESWQPAFIRYKHTNCHFELVNWLVKKDVDCKMIAMAHLNGHNSNMVIQIAHWQASSSEDD